MWQYLANIGNIVRNYSQSDDYESIFIKNKSDFSTVIAVDFILDESSGRREIKFTTIADFSKEKEKKVPDELLKRYFYIGQAGGNRPNFTLTLEGDAAKSLFIEAIPNFMNYLKNFKSRENIKSEFSLYEKLEKILKNFFIAIEKEEDKKRSKKKSTPLLCVDPKLLSPEIPENFLMKKKEVENFFKDFFKESYGSKLKKTLFTVYFNGEALTEDKDYRDTIKRIKLESTDNDKKLKKGICSFCGREELLTDNTAAFKYKVYNTDKLSFAPNFRDKDFIKSLGVCQKCYADISVGELWAGSKLETRLGNLPLMIIPEFQTDNPEKALKSLNRILDKFEFIRKGREEYLSSKGGEKNPFSVEEQVGQALKLGDKVKKIDTFSMDSFLHLVFYRKVNSAFKVLTWIPEVPPSRMERIVLARNLAVGEFRNERGPLFDALSEISQRFSLDKIYYLIPLRKKGKDILNIQKILSLYRSIFNLHPIEKNFLMAEYCSLAHIHAFESYSGHQISSKNSSLSLIQDTILWYYFLKFLSRLNLIDLGGDGMTFQGYESIPSELRTYIEKAELPQSKAALVILGYCVGVVASAQYQANLKNRPILKKLDYQGMNREKVIRLFNTIFEKLYQYDAGFAEEWLATAKALYASADDNLSIHERLFYILLGYSLNQLGRMKKSQQSEDGAVQ